MLQKRASKARQVRVRKLPTVDVHLAEFGAAVERRDRLVRVEQAVRIEGALHRVKGFELAARKLHAHRIDLLDADPVFAGDGAADFYAQGQDRGPEFLG